MNNTQAGARADSFSTTVTCLSVKAYKTSYPKYLSISPQKFKKINFTTTHLENSTLKNDEQT